MASATQTAKTAKNLTALFKSITVNDENLVRISRSAMRTIVAPLLSQMGLTAQTTSPVSVLDSAAGSGVFTQETQAVLPRDVLEKSSFICADVSPNMVELVKKRISLDDWVNTEAKVLDAMNTGLATDEFSHVAVCLGLHLIPDPDAVVKDSMRILKSGGTFGATTFHEDNGTKFWIPDFQSAFASFPFDAPLPEKLPMQMHTSGKWTDADWVEGHLRDLGLMDVHVKVHHGSYRLESAAEFVSTFGMMLPWVVNTHWSEETRAAHPLDEVKELMLRHLEAKHRGEGWEVDWLMIGMTGVVA